jgi:osmoprotectant transport system permease protein
VYRDDGKQKAVVIETMEIFQQAIEYALDPAHHFLTALGTHLQLSLGALLLGAAFGLPVGILISRSRIWSQATVNLAGVVRVIPSLALLFLLIPLLHTGFAPSLAALTVLAIPPLLINTEAGVGGVDKAIIEAGRGMGMTAWGLLRRVQLPLALPVIVAGLRIAAIEVISSATLASFIGGGGLGDFINEGLSLGRRYDYILLVGAVPVAVLALLTEVSLSYLQRLALRRRHTA